MSRKIVSENVVSEREEAIQLPRNAGSIIQFKFRDVAITSTGKELYLNKGQEFLVC